LGQKRKTREEASQHKKSEKAFAKKRTRGPEFEVARADGSIKGKKIFEQKDNKAAKKYHDKKKTYSSD
jgi:hypothetical protein